MIPLARIKHYFFPQTSNNQRARFLHPSFISIFVGLFLVSQFFLNYFSFFFPRVLGYAADISPEKVIELTNIERTKRGFAPLKDNQLLDEAALRKAGDMFALNYWAHNSPTGRTPWGFFKEVGYNYILAGENLARDFNDSPSVISAWMDSPTHRDNILNEGYQEIGIAVVNGTLEGVETTLIVQLFGTPTPAVSGTKVTQSEQKSALSKIPVIGQAEATASSKLPLLGTLKAVPEEKMSKTLNPFSLTKILIIFLLALILGILVLDIYLVATRRIVRLTGRSLAHLIFLLFLLLAILALQPGLIT